MASFTRPPDVTFSRWRNPHLRSEVDFVAHIDESQGTETSASESTSSTAPGHHTEETLTVEDALDAIGFGPFQWKMLFLAGLSWIGDAMEMMILSILGPQLHCEWRLPSYKIALLTSVVFVGMGISSPLWGKLSDKYGRKIVLVICMCCTLYYGLLSAFSPVYGWLLFLRGLVGFGIGGAPQAVTMYSEFLPSKKRGVYIMLIAMFWAIGAVFEVLLALLVMPTLGWRWLLSLSTLPIAVFICFCFWLPESPRFDAMTGQIEKALATLTSIAKQNGKAMPQGKMVAYKMNNRGQVKDLFTPQYRKTTLLLWFIWFSNAFSYYGIVLLTTEMFQAGDSCGATQGAKIEPNCSLECKYLTTADYKDLLWTTFSEFPGLMIAILAVECIGRRRSMGLCFFIFSLSILPLYACIGRTALTIFIFFARAFISGGYQIVFVYTPEVFPTEFRALAMGTSSAVAKLGALITPFVAQVLLRSSVYLVLSVYCGCCVLAGIASLMLPIETLGRGLQESRLDQAAGEQEPRSTEGKRKKEME